LGLALALAAPAAVAQTQIPGTFNPITPLRPPRAPGVQPGLPPPAPPIPAPTTPATYAITSAAVVGATAYSPAVLGGVIAGLTGPAVPAARIEAARTAIVARYRRDGYLYTTVDAVVGDGRLRFVVIEGRIVDVRLAGNIGPAGTQVLRFLDHLVQQRPLRQGSLERWLLLASDIPGVTVRSILNPTDTPGDLVLVAQLSRKPFDVQAIADNRAFRQTGPEEYLLIGDLNSFTEFGERTEFDFYHTFNGTEVFGEARTQFFIGGSGLQGRLYGGAGDATPSGDLRAIGYNGRTIVFGGQLSYPLIRSRPQTLNLVGQFDAIESDISTTTGPDGARVRSSFDSLRVFRAGLDYSLLDTWLGGAHPATDNAMLRLSQGVPGLGASSNGATDAPRSGERVDFFKAVMQVSRTQTLFSPWADASVALQPTLIGQVSNSVLPPEEKYYLGGPHFNRGYYYGQVTGDNAFVTSNELQLITPLPWHVVPSAPLDATFYLFYDYGRTWENQSVDPNRVLNSAGGGVRLNASRYLEVDLEGDWRINRYPLGGGVSPLQGAAFYWSVTLRY
jgi:hemolysin activation/secretion protein